MIPSRRPLIRPAFIAILLIIPLAVSTGCGGGGSPTTPAPSITAYYVDASAGNDGANGKTQAEAWQTLANINAGNYSGAVVIYLKRGSVWNESITLTRSNVRIDSYGTGALPQLDGSMALSNAWTDRGGGIYSQSVSLTAGGALGNLTVDGTMMAPVPWDDDATTTLGSAAAGSYSFNFFTDTIYIKPIAAPAGSVFRASVCTSGITADGLSNIVIANIAITRFSFHGINIKDSADCTVRNTVVTRCGGAAIALNTAPSPDFIHAGNGVEFGNSATGGLADNVSVSEIFDSGVTAQTYDSNQTGSGITFRNSTIDTCGFAGVEISVLSTGATVGSRLDDIAIENTTITGTGTGWSGRRYGIEGHGIRVKADTGAGAITDMVIASSAVSGSAGDGIYIGGESGTVTVHQTRITSNAGAGTRVADASAATIGLTLTASLIHDNGGHGLSYNAPSGAGMTVYQNTFFNNTVIHLAIFGQAGLSRIKNNLFGASTAMTHFFSSTALSGLVLDANAYTRHPAMVGYNGAAYNTLSAFAAATGFASNGMDDVSPGGNALTYANILMTDPLNGDFSLQSGTPVSGKGESSLDVVNDFINTPFADPPAIGAFEE